MPGLGSIITLTHYTIAQMTMTDQAFMRHERLSSAQLTGARPRLAQVSRESHSR